MNRRLPHFDSRLATVSLLIGVALIITVCALLLPARTMEAPVELLKMERKRGQYHPEQTATGRFETPVTLTIPADPETWDKIDRLVLLVSLSRRALPLASARLEFPGAGCGFESHQSTLYDDGELILQPMQCERPVKPGEVLEGHLTIQLASPNSLGLVALRRTTQSAGLLRYGPEDADGQAAYGLGRFMTTPDNAPISRAEQIAAIWSLPWLSWAAPLVLCIGALLVTVGGVVLSIRAQSSSGPWQRVLAAGLFALALGIAYVVIVPPFQAPDEPDHFLSFARVAGQPELVSDAKALAMHSHFERIHFHRWERFLPAHMKRPYPVPWTEVDAKGIVQVSDSAMETRSTLTTGFWKACAFLFRGEGASKTLLGLRLLNAALWALACMIGLWLIEAIAPKNRVFPLFLFFIPSLPFFATHVSNFAQYAQILTVAGCFTLALFLRGGRLRSGGVLLGLLSSAVLLSASSGVVMLGWVGCMALGRLLIVIRDRAASVRDAAYFWFGLVLGWAPILALLDGPQFKRLDASLQTVLAMLGLSDTVVLNSAFVAALFVAFGLAGVLCEMLVSLLGAKLYPAARHLVIWSNRLVALGLGLLLMYAPYTQYMIVPHDMKEVGVAKYMALAFHNIFSSLSFREPDLMLATTFWSGFGWHDALFPPTVVQVFAGIAGCGLFVAMVSVGADYRRSARMLATVVGALAAGILMVLVVASGVGGGQPNVHGRYLLGTYLVALSLAFSGFSPAVWAFAKRRDGGHAMAFDWRGQRTSIELLMTWSGFAAGGMTMYMAGWPWIFPTLQVPLAWLFFLFAVVVPLFCAVAIRLFLKEAPPAHNEALKRSPRPMYYLLLGLVVFCSLAFAELTVNLPTAALFSFDFYTLLPSVMALLFLFWLYRPAVRGVRYWLAPGALVLAAAMHAGCVAFLLERYFG